MGSTRLLQWPLAVVTLCGLLAASLPAWAQADSPEARRSVAKALIKAVDELSGPERTMKVVSTSIYQALQQQIGANERLTSAQKERAAQVMSQEATAAVGELVREAVPAMYAAMEDLYVERFSLLELQEVQRFYSSIAGRKSMSVMMDDMPRMMQPMMKTMRDRSPQVQQRLEAAVQRLRAEGIDFEQVKP